MKRYIKIITLVFLITNFIFIIESCANKEKNQTEKHIQNSDITKGKEIYTKYCQNCHQIDGKGVQGAFPSLNGKQANVHVIVNGKEGTVMKAFKHELSEEQIFDVIQYVNRSWGNNFSTISIDSIRSYQ